MVTIGNVRGAMDSSVLDPEPGPEGPFISYSYYVTYDFVEDEDNEGNAFRNRMRETQPESDLAEVCPAYLGPSGFCVHTEQLFRAPQKIFHTESHPPPCRVLVSA